MKYISNYNITKNSVYSIIGLYKISTFIYFYSFVLKEYLRFSFHLIGIHIQKYIKNLIIQ
jgi:hypothetical protein